MRKLQRAVILTCLFALLPLSVWSIPIHRTDKNRQLHPLIDQLADRLDGQGIDALFEYRGERIEAGTRPRLAPLDNFPIGDPRVYDWVSPTGDLSAWVDAYRAAEGNRAILAVESSTPGEALDFAQFRDAWARTPRAKRVFISYTSANEAQAAVIKKLMTEAGYSVFTYRERGTNVTNLPEVFSFFREAGIRYAVDSFEARLSDGVQIEALFQRMFLQADERAARKLDRFLDTQLERLQKKELALEQDLARKPATETKDLIKERAHVQHQIESVLRARREPPPRPKDPPEPPPVRRPPGPPKPPASGLSGIGDYAQRIKTIKPASSFQARLGITPMRAEGGVILGNNPAPAPKAKSARFDASKPAVIVEIDGKPGSFEFNAMNATELWAAYHMLRPDDAHRALGVKPGDAGVCGIAKSFNTGWEFALHPAVADTILAREAMRLDMVLALRDKTLAPVPSGWTTYRWFDESAVILAERGTIYVKAATAPHFTLMRVHLWADRMTVPPDMVQGVQMAVDARYAVADMYYRFDALRHIDRFAKVLAVLRWLDSAGKLPNLPAEIQPERVPTPAVWHHKDVLFDYAAIDRPTARGHDALTAAAPTKSHSVDMSSGVSYSVQVVSAGFPPTLRMEDAGGQVVAQAGPDLKSRGACNIVFTPTQNGAVRIVVGSAQAKLSGAYALTIQSAKIANAEIKARLTASDPLLAIGKGRSYHHVHTVELAAGNTYAIEMHAENRQALDAFLRVEDGKGAMIVENDDIDLDANNTDARVVIEPTHTAAYRIIATSLEPGQTGAYSLSVKQVESVYPERDYGLPTDLGADAGDEPKASAEDKKAPAPGAGSDWRLLGGVIAGVAVVFVVCAIIIARRRPTA